VALETKPAVKGLADGVRETMLLYKKQVTWFKRNSYICWVDEPSHAEELVREFLRDV
jgi:tRNA A37 N6-isopentenylltransferase MiaA